MDLMFGGRKVDFVCLFKNAQRFWQNLEILAKKALLPAFGMNMLLTPTMQLLGFSIDLDRESVFLVFL